MLFPARDEHRSCWEDDLKRPYREAHPQSCIRHTRGPLSTSRDLVETEGTGAYFNIYRILDWFLWLLFYLSSHVFITWHTHAQPHTRSPTPPQTHTHTLSLIHSFSLSLTHPSTISLTHTSSLMESAMAGSIPSVTTLTRTCLTLCSPMPLTASQRTHQWARRATITAPSSRSTTLRYAMWRITENR